MTGTAIEAVIFDLGRVLVGIDNDVMVEKLFAHIGTDDPQLVARTMQSSHMIDLCSGRIDLQGFHRQMSETYQSDLSFDAFKELWCSIFYTMNGAEELLADLDGTVKLGLLSDTDAVHWHYLKDRWPWLETIPKPTLSYEVGLMKPAVEIYRRAAANVETPPEQCLFIDDLEANVQGARAAGMQAIRFESHARLRTQLKEFGIL